MEIWEGKGVNDTYDYAVKDVLRFGRKVTIDRPDAVDSFTTEMSPGIFHFSDPRQRLVTSYGRAINVPFALAEVLWIISGRRDVEMLQHYNSTISQFSDDGLVFNAAYGYRLRHSYGFDQIEDVVRSLQDDRSTRQATLVITNPVDDKGWNRVMSDNPDDMHGMSYTKKRTKDRACNLLSHALLRDDKLDWMQALRSNDIIWGTPYNFMQFMHLQEYIASRVGADVGTYTHMAHSLHIYSHHYDDAQALDRFDLYEALGDWRHAKMIPDIEAINVVMREEQYIRERPISDSDEGGRWELLDAIGEYWMAVLDIFFAWRLYKEGQDRRALQTLLHCADPVLAAGTFRFMYEKRWSKNNNDMVLVEAEAQWGSKVALWAQGVKE